MQTVKWNNNEDGKTYPHTINMVLYEDKRPFWEQLGFETIEDFNNATILIDMKTGKKYDFSGKEL